MQTGENQANQAQDSATEQPMFSRKILSPLRTMNGSSSNADLEALAEKVEEGVKHFESQVGKDIFHAGQVPATDGGLLLPVQYIALDMKDVVLVTAAMLEGMKIRPQESREITGTMGKEYLPPITSSLDDDVLRNAVIDAVSAKMGVGREKIFICNVMIVPAHIDLKSMDIINYIDAMFVSLMDGAQDSHAPFNCAELRSYRTINRVQIHPGQTNVNAVGEPVAADVTCTLNVEDRSQKGNNTEHGGVRSTSLVQASAKLDMVDVGVQTNMYAAQTQQVDSTRYRPHVIITDVNGAADGEAQESLLGQILGVCSAAPLLGDYSFLHIATQMSNRSIANLAKEYDATTGTAPAKPAAPKLQNVMPGAESRGSMSFVEFAHKYIKPSMMVSSDIVVNGPLYSIQGVLLAAAEGNPDAIEAIIATVEEFTGGSFSRHWNGGSPFLTNPLFLPSGFYLNQAGNRCDVRDLDALSMLERDQHGTMELQNFKAATQIGGGSDELSNRLRNLYREEFSGSFVETGEIARLTWNPGFIVAVMRAMHDQHVAPEIEGLTAVEANRPINFNDDVLNASMPQDLLNHGHNSAIGGYAQRHQVPLYTQR